MKPTFPNRWTFLSNHFGSVTLFFFILISTFSYSQSFEPTVNSFDSIESLILSEKNVQKKLTLILQLGKNTTKPNTEKTFTYGYEALRIGDSTKSIYGKAIGHLLLGLGYNEEANTPLALDHYQKSLEMSELIKDSTLILESLRGLFYIYWGIKDYESAFAYVNKRLRISKKLGLSDEIASCFNNYALVFESTQKNDSAVAMYTKAIRLLENSDNKSRLPIFYNNLGITLQANLLKPAEALPYQLKALQMSKEMGIKYITSYISISLGRTLTDLGQYSEAEKYFLEGLPIAKKNNDYYILQEGYDAMYAFYKKTNKTEKALQYLEYSKQLKDSIFNYEKLNTLSNLRLNYEIQKKELVLAQHRSEIKNKNRLIVNFIIILLFAATGGFLLYQSRLEKIKINKILEVKNQELVHKNEEIHAQKDLLEEQHEEIQTQANQLSQINEEINIINESLEQKVAERTIKLEEQNKKLLEYNFMNSHVLRSPVARLKGLFNIIALENDIDKKLEYMDLFKQSVEDLDNFTKTVSDKLNKED